MKNLIIFIFKHHFFFLFIVFECLSITLYVENNYYPQARIFNINKEISGNIEKSRNRLSQYLSLAKVNKEIAEQNALLLSYSLKSFVKVDTATFRIKDTLYKQQYIYTAAKVINNTINRRNNYLTLNKGRKDGIEKDMAVITKYGIVGIVKSVSWNYSSVISILNSKSKISAKIKRNNYIGSIMWESMDYQTGVLRDIPSHAIITKGDTVITSGYSTIFPSGIPIGTILYYKTEKGESFYTIYIKFTNDFDKLNYVYVIKNIHKEEQDKLEHTSQND